MIRNGDLVGRINYSQAAKEECEKLGYNICGLVVVNVVPCGNNVHCRMIVDLGLGSGVIYRTITLPAETVDKFIYKDKVKK